MRNSYKASNAAVSKKGKANKRESKSKKTSSPKRNDAERE